MNCENCKKARATVFYADDGGKQHSLCASCAQILDKISPYDPHDGIKTQEVPFIPCTTLLSLMPPPQSKIYCSHDEKHGKAVCPFCATSLETVLQKGRVGCPECYTVFSYALFPSSLSPESAHGARMPSSRRSDIDRLRSISELKAQIRIAVESENYELAATLRDKIRTLESAHR